MPAAATLAEESHSLRRDQIVIPGGFKQSGVILYCYFARVYFWLVLTANHHNDVMPYQIQS